MISIKVIYMTYREFYLNYPHEVDLVFKGQPIPGGNEYKSLTVEVDPVKNTVLSVKETTGTGGYIYANYHRLT